MKKIVLAGFAALLASAAVTSTLTPGSRTLVLAHNAYPDHGKYADRLDRALASGRPFVVEEDLSWIDGKSLLIHGAKNAGGEDPTMESYFFPKVKPLMEKALREGNKGDWPLITVYLDIKNDPREHLEAISAMLDEYDAWLTSAVKTADISKQSLLTVKPMLLLTEDKENDPNKLRNFYDRVPVGGRIRVFGSPDKIDTNPGRKLAKDEATARMASVDPEQLVRAKADNYRRWWGLDWAYIEKGGQPAAGEWSKEKEARLHRFVDYAHRMGYLVSVSCLNGYTVQNDLGWDKDYNFGSPAAARVRWDAAVQAKVDFIATDQYEDLSRAISR